MIIYLAYAVILLLPSYLLKIKLPTGGSINGLDIVQTLFISVFIYWVVARKRFSPVLQFVNQRKKQLLAVILFLSGTMTAYISNISAENWIAGAGMIKSYFLLPVISAILIAYLVQEGKVIIKGIWGTYYCYSTALGLISLGYLSARQLTFDHRLAAFFDSPNFLAMALSPGIIIGLYFFIRHHKHRSALILSLLPQIIAVWATDSLGAILGLTAAAAVIFLPNWSKLVSYAIFSLSIITFACIPTLPVILSSVDYTPTIPPTSADSRLAIYGSAGRILKDHWLLGIGPGKFQETYLQYQRFFAPYPQWAVPHPHNLLLAVWVELGILAILSFCYLLARRLSHLSQDHAVLILALTGYFILHGLVDTTIWKNDLAQFFWIILLL